MNREYHKWHSSALEQEMELLVFGHTGARVIVFPTRDGRFYDFENWRLVEAVSDKIEQGRIQLFCVDSHDRFSLYADWMCPEDRMKQHLTYERYVIEEVIPFSEEKNDNSVVIAHGCSLGGYHAMNIGLRYPDIFGGIVSLSGRYDLTKTIGNFRDLFDGYYDQLIYQNMPCHYLPQIEDETQLAKLRKLKITFTIGEEDAFLPNNRALARTMSQKEIPHDFFIWEGEAHRAHHWRQMIKLYL